MKYGNSIFHLGNNNNKFTLCFSDVRNVLVFVNASEVHIFQFQSWQCIKRFLDVPEVKFVLMCGRMEANNNDLCLGCHHS